MFFIQQQDEPSDWYSYKHSMYCKGQYKDPPNRLHEQWGMVWAGGEQCLGSRGVTIAVLLLKCRAANYLWE